jgi:hypothetical protein
MRRLLIVLLASFVAAPLYAQNANNPQNATNQGQVRLVIVDETGAGIPGATIVAKPQTGEPISAMSDERGVVTLPVVPVGSVQFHVEFLGFEAVDKVLNVRRGATNETITMKIAGLQEQVVVSDAETVLDDRRGNSLTTTLEQAEIDQLPDDPDDLQAYLEQMVGGRGATFIVNGFRGGRLPSRDEIRQIRFRTNSFSADNHDAGRTQIEIITKPNVREWSGNANYGLRNDALNARNAFAPVKLPEDINRFNMGLRGPIVSGKTSIRLNVDGNRTKDSDTIYAYNPDGSRIQQSFNRPSDRTNVNLGIESALTKNQTLRIEYRNAKGNAYNQGVGGYNLLDRAYTRTNDGNQLRAQVQGLIGKTTLNELRFEFNTSNSASTALTNAPTIIVLDGFTSGGANNNAQNSNHTFELADNLDFNAGKKHQMRVGFLLNGGSYSNFDARNQFGTITYGSLTAYNLDLWTQKTQRTGSQVPTNFSNYQLGVYWQDDIRVNKKFSYSIGVRNELQSLISDKFNPMPRVGFTWNPVAKMSIRGGYGLFYDWYDTGTWDQVLRLSGGGQTDLIQFREGLTPTGVLPGRTQNAANIQLPQEHQMAIGIERPITNNLTLQVNYQMLRGRDTYRALNINAPVNGVAPDPTSGVVTEIRSNGKSDNDSLTFNTTFRIPSKRLFMNANYTLGRSYNYADGALSMPVNSLDPNAEWGPSFSDIRNRFNVQGQFPLIKGFRGTLQVNGQSASPYNITTGFDTNQDGVVNDRPAGVGRNAARGASQWQANARVGRQFAFGGPRNGSGTDGRQGGGNTGGTGGRPANGGGRGASPQQGFGGGGRGGGNFNGGGGDNNNNQRFSMELYAQAQNLFNNVNYTSYSSVLTSRNFGQPTAAAAARKIELGLQFRF